VVVEAVEACEVKAGFAALAAPVGEHGHPVGVVVVAEVLVAESQRAAAAAVDEDVTAEEGLGRGFWFWRLLLLGFWWIDLDGFYDRQLGDGRLGDG